jgi:hypothetical protein
VSSQPRIRRTTRTGLILLRRAGDSSSKRARR